MSTFAQCHTEPRRGGRCTMSSSFVLSVCLRLIGSCSPSDYVHICLYQRQSSSEGTIKPPIVSAAVSAAAAAASAAVDRWPKLDAETRFCTDDRPLRYTCRLPERTGGEPGTRRPGGRLGRRGPPDSAIGRSVRERAHREELLDGYRTTKGFEECE